MHAQSQRRLSSMAPWNGQDRCWTWTLPRTPQRSARRQRVVAYRTRLQRRRWRLAATACSWQWRAARSAPMGIPPCKNRADRFVETCLQRRRPERKPSGTVGERATAPPTRASAWSPEAQGRRRRPPCPRRAGARARAPGKGSRGPPRNAGARRRTAARNRNNAAAPLNLYHHKPNHRRH